MATDNMPNPTTWKRLNRMIPRVLRRQCRHDFEENDTAKRFCRKCGEEQWLFSKRFPMPGEPALTWEIMREGDR